MFKYLRVKQRSEIYEMPFGTLTGEWLATNDQSPIQILQINNLPEKVKRRIYRCLVPADLLVRFSIDPISWRDSSDRELVILKSGEGKGVVQISACKSSESESEFYHLELADNSYGTIDLNFLILSDPDSPRYNTDYDEQGNLTLFGTVRRNLAEETRAMVDGLAPGQVRSGLGASKILFSTLEIFLLGLGQRAYFLEPLTYASAWIFEKRGFAYVRGHKLMEDIHFEFQPGGKLHGALDNSSPFRQADAWNTVRGRAWAIHDGILEVIGARWDGLRMVKQIGRLAGVETFPAAVY